MAFTDVKGSSPRKVLQGWGLDHVLLKETVVVGDPIGVDQTNEWGLAKATARDYRARYVAAEDGEDGDTIGVFRMAVLEAAFGATLADFGNELFLADTAGYYTAAVGTVTQNLGWITDATHILVHPRTPLTIDSSDLGNNSVDSDNYVDGSIDPEHFAVSAVDSTALADNSVDTGALQADSVTSTILADDSVDTAALQDDAVDSTRLADDAVDTGAIQDNAVTATKLNDTVLGRLAVTIVTGTSDSTTAETVGAYSPVAGNVVAVQFLNESNGAFTTAADLKVASYSTACAESGTTLADGAVFRDTTINGTFDDVGVGATLAFTSGKSAGDQPQSCIVEIEYKINAVVTA